MAKKKILSSISDLDSLKDSKHKEKKEIQKPESKPKRKYTKQKTLEEITDTINLSELKADTDLFLEKKKDVAEINYENSKVVKSSVSKVKNIEESIDNIAYFKELLSEYKTNKKKDNEWDVKLSDPIEYFDPELSYELTGYKPINKTRGLDFNPKDFCKDAEVKSRTGKYTTFQPGGRAYRDWWLERQKRCIEGYTCNGYTLTGDHYFFMNFYMLPINTKSDNSALADIDFGFPTFVVQQYIYFHYVKMAEILGKDVAALKSRGVGFSEIAACLGVRMYTCNAKTRVMYTAFVGSYLDDVLNKCWTQLDFLNQETEYGFSHLRQGINKADHKRASLKDKDGNEFGFKSEILGIVADHPRKLRGKRGKRLLFEEAGSNPYLIEEYVQGEALVQTIQGRIGTRLVWGE